MTESGALEYVVGVLDRLEIRYCVGSSVASSAYGLARQTNDIDLLADFNNTDMAEFCRLLRDGGFYIDEQSAFDGVQKAIGITRSLAGMRRISSASASSRVPAEPKVHIRAEAAVAAATVPAPRASGRYCPSDSHCSR